MNSSPQDKSKTDSVRKESLPSGWVHYTFDEHGEIVPRFPASCVSCLEQTGNRVFWHFGRRKSYRIAYYICPDCHKLWTKRQSRATIWVLSLLAVVVMAICYRLHFSWGWYDAIMAPLIPLALLVFVSAAVIDHFVWPFRIGVGFFGKPRMIFRNREFATLCAS